MYDVCTSLSIFCIHLHLASCASPLTFTCHGYFQVRVHLSLYPLSLDIVDFIDALAEGPNPPTQRRSSPSGNAGVAGKNRGTEPLLEAAPAVAVGAETSASGAKGVGRNDGGPSSDQVGGSRPTTVLSNSDDIMDESVDEEQEEEEEEMGSSDCWSEEEEDNGEEEEEEEKEDNMERTM